MRGWAINAWGEPMQVMDLPVPRPGPNDLLLWMRGAEIGEWDEQVRLGKWPVEPRFPLVLGLAGAGIVVAAGVNVRGFAEGDRAYACGYPLYENGAWAEYMLLPDAFAAAPPAGLELVTAGGVPIAGLTAHETLLDLLRIQRGDIVLVTAASGGVGHLAVQIARHHGARVVATACPRDVDFVKALGAETVISEGVPDLAKAIRTGYPDGVGKALNNLAGEAANRLTGALADGGHIVDLTGAITAARPGLLIDKDYRVHGDGKRLSFISAMIDDGLLEVEIQDIVPFGLAPDALKTLVDGQVRGNLVLEI
jgi:NADPH:quinone reductase-like Zn-dependent oxidoreductase